MQTLIVTLECKALETNIRLGGLIEERGGNIGEIITELIAEYLEEQQDEVRYNLEQVYRVNSKYAMQNQIPRDVVVQFSSRKMKEELLNKIYKDPLEYEGQTIRVLKELPKKVTESRKQFKPIVDKLKKYQNSF